MAAQKDKKKRLEYIEFQEGSSLKGILNHKEPLSIAGNFEGEINNESYVNIASTSVVKAHITARDIESEGEIHGNLTASEHVFLKSGSKLIGNIKTPSLEMEDGVIFDGQSEMLINNEDESSNN